MQLIWLRVAVVLDAESRRLEGRGDGRAGETKRNGHGRDDVLGGLLGLGRLKALLRRDGDRIVAGHFRACRKFYLRRAGGLGSCD